ncbi:LapA family protein [Alteriqipengyuania sp. 357]
MQIVRTIIWVLILVGVVLFSFFNWREVEVTIWDNLVLETKVPALVIISFLLGFLPTWLYARGVIWSLNRKIRSLEIAAKASSVSAAAREADRDDAERKTAADTPAAAAHDAGDARPVEETARQGDTRLAADTVRPGDIKADDINAGDDDATSDAPRVDTTTQDKSATP